MKDSSKNKFLFRTVKRLIKTEKSSVRNFTFLSG